MDTIKTFAHEVLGQVRVVTIDGNDYFVANDVCNALAHTNASKAISDHVAAEFRKVLQYKDYHTIFPELWDKTNDFRNKIVVSEDGVSSLIMCSQKITTEKKREVISTLQTNGFCKNIVLKTRPEIEFGEKLENVLFPMHIKMIKQYFIGNYYIDFYFPEFNLAVEYDENGHQDYDFNKEIIREEYIKEKLGCDVLRLWDEIDDNINIGRVLAKIFGR